MKTQNKKAIGYIEKQGQLLKKSKDTEIFLQNFGQSQSTIYFKVGLCKFFEEIPEIK